VVRTPYILHRGTASSRACGIYSTVDNRIASYSLFDTLRLHHHVVKIRLSSVVHATSGFSVRSVSIFI